VTEDWRLWPSPSGRGLHVAVVLSVTGEEAPVTVSALVKAAFPLDQRLVADVLVHGLYLAHRRLRDRLPAVQPNPSSLVCLASSSCRHDSVAAKPILHGPFWAVLPFHGYALNHCRLHGRARRVGRPMRDALRAARLFLSAHRRLCLAVVRVVLRLLTIARKRSSLVDSKAAKAGTVAGA